MFNLQSSSPRSLLIDGHWLAAQGERCVATFDPSTGETLGHLACAGADEVARAVNAARAALHGGWGRLAPVDRGRFLLRWAALVERELQSLAAVESADSGKPLSVARRDMLTVARYLEFYGGAADKLHGATLPYYPGYGASVLREPHGVTAHIIPWNYPASQFARTVAPALAMGNACVVKPSEEACLSVLHVAQLAIEAGLPAGALNIVTGLGPEAGAALSAHPGVNFVSFTGSPHAGMQVQQAAARNHVACTLELGGKSPQIVFADADMDRALPAIIRGIVQHAGQTCSAGSRLLVQRSAVAEVSKRIGQAFDALQVGTPAMDLDCGPVMNARQRAGIVRATDAALRDGIRLLGRGVLALGLPERGHWVEPMAFGEVPRDHALAMEEVFGPVLCVQAFDDEADALTLANATPYGLVAAVWTADGNRQQRLARGLRCGQVFINCFSVPSGVELPFGGTGKSGHGREKGMAALEHMSITKTVVHHYGFA